MAAEKALKKTLPPFGRLSMSCEARGNSALFWLQFPYSFHNDAGNRKYLSCLRELLPELQLVAEIRHYTWGDPRTVRLFQELDIGFVGIDGPKVKGQITGVVHLTSDIAYVRFHGRNQEQWWDHKEAYERYNYRYQQRELFEWVPVIGRLTDRQG
jgi:uncharacterized protein YecE (DUF72 family)